MAFIVEDGTGLNNANSLVSLEYANEYFATRNIAAWDLNATDEQKESWLIQATDYVSAKLFLGVALTETQSLPFPRTISGYLEMPEQVKRAVCEYALNAKNGVLFFTPKYDASGLKIVEVASSLTSGMNKRVRYSEYDTVVTERIFPYPDSLLKPLLRSATGYLTR